MEYRKANEDDVEGIAALHADSWRRNYRGAFADAYLDGDLLEERRGVWAERLRRPGPDDDTVVVVDEQGAIVGFAHTILDHHPTWGALLDNLHVAHHLKGRGVGTELMARSAAAVLARGRIKVLHLEVLEGNTAAQAFYDARGGMCVHREDYEPPGGGTTVSLRYVWTDPSILVAEQLG